MEQTRRKGRAQNRTRSGINTLGPQRTTPPPIGGRYYPLDLDQVTAIDGAARDILQRIGFSDAPGVVVDAVSAAGGELKNGRLLLPNELVDRALRGITNSFSLFGQVAENEMELSGNKVHVGSGGAAPRVLDLETSTYRESVLEDLYNAARLVDCLSNIHFFSRPMIACDMPDLHSLDINTTYACLSGTKKHVCVSVSLPEHVAEIADMCYTIAGSARAFMEKPFLSLNVNHAIPPLRLDRVACEVMAEGVRLGMPIHANTFGQLGASSPVTMAGCIAQTIAETFAGMIFAWLINPEAKVVFGMRPMVTDLRTGAMSGGSGEQALLMAAVTQMAQYYNLPNSTIAGATDSKLPDVQSGYEKALTVSLAAQAGSNLITQACGMQASLTGCALESYVIDNDMLGSILKSLDCFAVDEKALAVSQIQDVVNAEGHFLGQSETLERMETDFLYPEISDRHSIEEWQDRGGHELRQIAREKTRYLLSHHYPQHISEATDITLRNNFDIRLPRTVMVSPSN